MTMLDHGLSCDNLRYTWVRDELGVFLLIIAVWLA